MTPQTMRAITAILEADQTVSGAEKTNILQVCQSPETPTSKRPDTVNVRFVTPHQAADLLQTSVRTVWRLAREGKLRRVKLGHRSTRFPLRDLDNLAR